MEKTTVYAIMVHFHVTIIQNFYFVQIWSGTDGADGLQHFIIVNYTKFLFWIIAKSICSCLAYYIIYVYTTIYILLYRLYYYIYISPYYYILYCSMYYLYYILAISIIIYTAIRHYSCKGKYNLLPKNIQNFLYKHLTK